jgi:hypothetical protein
MRGLPYGMVSLLDVLKFAAEDFWKASQTITEWSRDAANPPMSKSRIKEITNSFGKFIYQVRVLSLPVTFKEIGRLRGWIASASADADAVEDVDKQLATYTEINLEFGRRLQTISNILHSEIEARTFFHMPAEQATFYDQKELFGPEVNAKFPSIQFDMVEAGNCYAMGRGTACVFHLMRIMEVGVQQFGTKLGVTLADEKNWQNILDETNKAIKTFPAKAGSTIEMSQAAANLYSVKLAWRNEVMHPNDTYTLEEAEDILRQVKLFMRQLATIL